MSYLDLSDFDAAVELLNNRVNKLFQKIDNHEHEAKHETTNGEFKKNQKKLKIDLEKIRKAVLEQK
jgi:hypothetical protein